MTNIIEGLPPTLIDRPTITSLRNLLDQLIASGWNPEQQIQISQLANAPSCHHVVPVEVWLGQA
jgi:hypothetical protein